MVWKTRIPGEGWSSPFVSGTQIWMTSATEDGKNLRWRIDDTGIVTVTVLRCVTRAREPARGEHQDHRTSIFAVLHFDCSFSAVVAVALFLARGSLGPLPRLHTLSTRPIVPALPVTVKRVRSLEFFLA